MGRGRRGRAWIAGAILIGIAAASVVANTRLDDPPRFDGAGYAVLGWALATGQGYREIDHPDRPLHDHFPPGYPIALALLWQRTGPSAAAAHGLSVLCTVVAVWGAWRWFRTLYPPRVALLLGLALAVNWTWGRIGGAIQSEPLFLMLSQLAVLAALWAGRCGGIGRGIALGLLLGACVVTRHAGLGLALAIGLDLLLRHRPATAAAAELAMTAVLLPWVAWQATVRRQAQVSLLPRAGLADLIARQALFYARRLPDQVTGPLVEIATVFRDSDLAAALATAWAMAATAVLLGGWLRALRTPRRRLAGLVPLWTLPMLLVWPFTEAGRFLVPLVPFVLVGAVEGSAGLLARAGLRRPRVGAAGLILALSIPYAAYAIAAGRAEAARRTHADFDAACAWIAQHGDRPGLILTRHPGEVFWQTGRSALAPPNAEAIARAIADDSVAYLLVDDERYARAPTSPLGRFAADHPESVELVRPGRGERPVTVYAVRSAPRR
ncbi:MAG: glycosyltransferase family 39 protein [Isosphaeraceae bacterium]|nr:glycosyltransferase family 39 protein [Isosphaeraceae bacterium]